MSKQLSTDSPSHPIDSKAIGEAFQAGRTVQWIAKKFDLSTTTVQRCLDIYLLAKGGVRTPSEILCASAVVRSNLVSAVMELSRQCTKDPDPDKVLKTVAIAAKVFSWPMPKAVANDAPVANAAINLSLIATKPDELKALALERATSLDMELESVHDSKAGASGQNGRTP